MRENNHFPEAPDSPVPPNADGAAGSHPAAFTDPANAAPHDAGTGAAPLPAARRRTRLIWLLVGAMAIAAAVAASAVVRKLQTDHALSRVASVAAMPPVDAVTRDFPGDETAAATADAQPRAGTTADAALDAGAAAAPARAIGDAAPGVVAGVAGAAGVAGVADAAGAAGAGRAAAQSAHVMPPAAANVEAQAGSSAAQPAPAKSSATKGAVAKKRLAKNGLAKNRVAKNSAARRAARRAAGGGDTFKRCPPLGKKGAVMCRWHICNGAAGKEAACRPYLERAP